MRFIIILLTCLLLTGCINTAISSANIVYCHKSFQDQATDCYVKINSWNKLKGEYKDEDLKHLQLTCFNRILLMTGQLPSELTRAQVEHFLQSIPKVARIYNATTVGPAPKALDHLQDGWITTKIKSKMITSNELYADKIKIVTENKIVYLLGIVTQDEANAAIKLAKETEGVRKVVNIFFYMTMPTI